MSKKKYPPVTDIRSLAGELSEIVCFEKLNSADRLPWLMNKFIADTSPLHVYALVCLQGLQPDGRGIKYTPGNDSGKFRSGPHFLRVYGFSFNVSHSEYSVEALNRWFFLSCDADWCNNVFADIAR